MSLKARIEAVIYAAEEPVTLAQLATLFREDALAAREERLAAEAAFLAASQAPADEAAIASEPGLSEAVEELAPEAPQALTPSEPAAQNSADAEVATPDFAGEPQSVPEPTASGGNETLNAAPAAPELAAASADPGSGVQSAEPGSETPEAQSASGESPDPETEKRATRQLDREIRSEIRRVLDELIADYSTRGLEIREVAGGFRFGTRPEYHDSVRAFVKSLKPPMKLSLQALETLAVIAYKQPVTAPEIAEIRGVDSGGVLGSLVSRKLITTAGRKQVIGRPILYKTTREFLLRFGLRDLNELPSIEEFEKMASELTEPDDSSGQELPFAQNEIAALEENAEMNSPDTAEGSSPSAQDNAEGDPPSAQDPSAGNRFAQDPKEPAPPMNEPEPDVPEPPIGEPPAEPEPNPTVDA